MKNWIVLWLLIMGGAFQSEAARTQAQRESVVRVVAPEVSSAAATRIGALPATERSGALSAERARIAIVALRDAITAANAAAIADRGGVEKLIAPAQQGTDQEVFFTRKGTNRFISSRPGAAVVAAGDPRHVYYEAGAGNQHIVPPRSMRIPHVAGHWDNRIGNGLGTLIYAFAAPPAPMIHSYDLLHLLLAPLYVSGTHMALFNAPESLKSAVARHVTIDAAHVTVGLSVQNNAFDRASDHPPIFRPHYAIHANAPYSQAGYNVESTAQIGFFDAPSGVTVAGQADGTLSSQSFSTHQAGGMNVLSPDNMPIAGIDNSNNYKFWSLVVHGGHAWVTLHVLLNAGDMAHLTDILNTQGDNATARAVLDGIRADNVRFPATGGTDHVLHQAIDELFPA